MKLLDVLQTLEKDIYEEQMQRIAINIDSLVSKSTLRQITEQGHDVMINCKPNGTLVNFVVYRKSKNEVGKVYNNINYGKYYTTNARVVNF